MSRIENATGRTDGNSGYTRAVGSEELGRLLSKVQATVIANGNELERLVAERCKLINDIDDFIKKAAIGEVANGVYLCLKKVFKKSAVYAPDVKGIEPDMLVFVLEKPGTCNIIELKDGDAFDTKKSLGEKEHLEKFSTILGAKIPFTTPCFICSFNQEDKSVIHQGFKGVFAPENILTGRELCKILKIDYEEIITIRRRDSAENLRYFIQEMMKIPEVRQEVIKYL